MKLFVKKLTTENIIYFKYYFGKRESVYPKNQAILSFKIISLLS